MSRPATRRRSRRGSDPSTPAKAAPDAFHDAPAPLHRPRLELLDEGGIARLRAAVLDLLADHGVSVRHAGAVERLRAAGARDGREAGRLRLPRELVEEALSHAPRAVTLCGKRPERDIHLPRTDGGFVMRTGTGAHGFVEPDTGRYRNLHVDDIPFIAALGSQLDQVGFLAHSFVAGVPEATADVHGLAALVAHTDKHVWIQPYAKENVEFLMRVVALAAGGEESLRRRPIASCIVCSFSPLEFKVMDVEALIACGRHGLPVHACALPSAGGTAPLTAPGHVLMAAAEIVAIVTMAHVLAPGTPVIATPLMFVLDMRTGSALQSCVEARTAAGMAVQLMKHGFGLVTHTYGAGSDTPDVDVQSLAERALLGETVALSGADILGGVGQLECATVFSPVQAVLDNELGAQLRRTLRPPVVDEDGLAFDEVAGMRPGGHFLDSLHTLRHCRSQHAPGVFLRQGRDDYEASDRRTALDAARETCLELARRPPPPALPDTDTRAALRKLVRDADRHILDALDAGAGMEI